MVKSRCQRLLPQDDAPELVTFEGSPHHRTVGRAIKARLHRAAKAVRSRFGHYFNHGVVWCVTTSLEVSVGVLF
jgi:hypothetical protein